MSERLAGSKKEWQSQEALALEKLGYKAVGS